MLTFRVLGFHFHVLPMRTRFPFRYGIASLDWLPHVVVTVDLEVAGKACRGMTAEGLPPKWFTKNPETPFEADLAEMIAVIQNAARIGKNAGQSSGVFSGWWRAVRLPRMTGEGSGGCMRRLIWPRCRRGLHICLASMISGITVVGEIG